MFADVLAGNSLAMSWGSSLAIVAAIAVVALLLLIYPAMVLRKYVRIMINILDEHAEVEENCNGRNGLSLVHENVSLSATDGHPLKGVILSARGQHAEIQLNGNGKNGHNGTNGNSHRPTAPTTANPPPAYRGTIVFAHEFGSVRTSCMRFCRPLLRAGYDVFAFDFRGHGESPSEEGYKPRQWVSDREQADMAGAIAFITSHLEKQGHPRNIGLFGLSRGAGASILGAVKCDDVRAIVTDGAFSSDTALEYLMRRFATVFARIRIVAENHPPAFWRFLRWLLFLECRRKFKCRFPSVRKAMRKLGPRPILFIHGEKDSYIPVAQSQILYDRALGPKSLWMVPGAKHNCAVSVRPDEYAQRVIAFLDEYLAVATPAPSIRVQRMPQPTTVIKPSPIPTTNGHSTATRPEPVAAHAT
jgi:uncharacterized protein